MPPEEVVYLLEGHVSGPRYKALLHEHDLIEKGEQEFSIDLFSEQERRLIEDLIMEREFHQPGGDRAIANCYATILESGTRLSFEAFIEDDGACIDLLTPYDERDGRFADLTDCLTERY